ncbi:hypothetical protein [Jeotgalibacillus proteolyticus]|uniref:hypothetical protein n=1 Tax=Jeotgalibacillus proteolyticus TaxID=2082395 RepID=UPI003CFA7AFD
MATVRLLVMLFIVFITSTVIIAWGMFTNTAHPAFFPFVLFYIAFLFGLFIFFIVKAAIQLKNSPAEALKKSVIRFLLSFLSLSCFVCLFYLFFAPELLDVSRLISISIGVAAGITLFGVIGRKEQAKQ